MHAADAQDELRGPGIPRIAWRADAKSKAPPEIPVSLSGVEHVRAVLMH